MHLGPGAQLLPRSDGYRRFTAGHQLTRWSPRRVELPDPVIRLLGAAIIHRRVAAPPTAVARVPG